MNISKQKYYIITKGEMYLKDSKNNIKFGTTGRPALYTSERNALAVMVGIGGREILSKKEVEISFKIKEKK